MSSDASDAARETGPLTAAPRPAPGPGAPPEIPGSPTGETASASAEPEPTAPSPPGETVRAAAARGDVKLPDQVYRDERPAEFFTPYHERTRAYPPGPIYDVVRVVLTVVALLVFRARAEGSEHVPNGPVIIAPNHGSFMDHFLCAVFLRRHVQFMAKSHMFRRRSVRTWIYSHGGVFPVRRGSRDEEVFITAKTILGRGGCLGMYVEGGRTRTGEMSQEAKPGLGRLALETGAVVVPVAITNSHKIRNWKRLQFPKVSVHYGEPLRFAALEEPSRGQQQAVANEVLRRIRTLYELNS